ncbi:hypothetical protein NIES2135_31810 [Leptolyngbya boryana NIES-2135]|jgi:hypothetical protein|uniref:Uncharacterized protein n=1 Tax=Leptolyngbya boryana NIES-2135 TaxID=1973484 RepID=A0A1Z4JHZ2_LEPBY|nr:MULTISPECIES: hypothetical protein [Leptolyngbya]BAY56350.1 hypothetical protein NIES2135_31810 [Leptolyngbya boryana NIES-2135]MBD2366457.1 hypothetical protein [Leptolyngbya sp. FACHB-161]MBD2372636.1 hypothetical protein [Leptolyngbya sp. FACHB-238]MBD2397059.1 hypothetical protein [Leptolyngbya sp. FACHB-239]MBD2403583.1 hypothetical protein [Leptolyngbya sp. FACHB-402]
MDKIQAQFAKLWKLLTAPETFDTYKSAVVMTWTIIKETALLVWLVLCLVLVFADWFWKISVGAGRSTRAWFNGLEGSSEQIASETGRALLNAGKSSLDYTLNQARAQLGFEIPAPAPAKVEPVKTEPVKAEPVKAEPAVTAPPPVVTKAEAIADE